MESIEPGLTTAQGILGIQGGVIRKKWRQDDAVALSKPGKTDELKGNLRRINLINSQAKQIEAILGDVVEAQSAVDPYQGGFTEGIEVTGRCFVLWTVLGYRIRVMRAPTFLCFIDMTAFFDTILPQVVAAQLYTEGVNTNKLLPSYLTSTNE